MRLGVALGALLGLMPSLLVRADPVRYAVRAELAAEYDSNPGRIEEIDGVAQPRVEPIVGSPVGRLVLSGELAVPIGQEQSLTLAGTAGGKRFLRSASRAEDALVVEASGAWNVRVSDRTALGLVGAYADVFQRRGLEQRDYTSIVPALRREQGVGEGGALTAGLGYRWFAYKPSAEFDFQGPSAYAVYRHFFPGTAGAADW